MSIWHEEFTLPAQAVLDCCRLFFVLAVLTCLVVFGSIAIFS